mgnify:CR=1 FL=1
MPEMPVTQAGIDETHLEAAADWFVRLDDDDTPTTRRAWQRWHDAAPAHRLAWQRVEKLQGLLAGAPPTTRQLLDKPEPRARRQFLTVIGVAIAAGLGYALLPAAPGAPTIEWIATAAGERRAISLPDGGRVWLSSGTRLGIAYGDNSRDLYLSQGAIQLTSGVDARGRPLRILARDGAVRPLGTRLTISTFDTRTVLAVQEHAAEVRPLNGKPVRVEAGQRVAFTPAGSGPPQATPVADDAWTRGLIMASGTPLSEFAEQFSFYSGRRVEVAPALANRRVSGTFQIDAPDRSLQTLANVLAIRVDKGADGWRLRPM